MFITNKIPNQTAAHSGVMPSSGARSRMTGANTGTVMKIMAIQVTHAATDHETAACDIAKGEIQGLSRHEFALWNIGIMG